jgi:hypothetical protein
VTETDILRRAEVFRKTGPLLASQEVLSEGRRIQAKRITDRTEVKKKRGWKEVNAQIKKLVLMENNKRGKKEIS